MTETKTETLTERVLREVGREREAQDAKWGPAQHHSLAQWMMILTEEVGEAAQAGNDATFSRSPAAVALAALQNFRAELVQVAAVAVKAIEDLDRNKHLEPGGWR